MIQNTTLEKWLVQMRRISEHREETAEKNIKRIYRELYKELQVLVSSEYLENATDDILNIESLQLKGRYARFLEEIVARTDYFAPQIEEEILNLVSDVYEHTYNSTIDVFLRASESELELNKEISTLQSVSKEVVQQAIQNPIYGLTLSDTLAKYRAEIIYNIKKNITIGLMNNDRYTTIAKRISKTLDNDYSKAIRIVRTEAHRVRESGSFDAAKNMNDTLSNGDTGYRMVKKWQTMEDERVRKTNKANHVKMNDKITEIEGYFNLGRGVKTLIPGNSGDASNDINCRCIVTYQLTNSGVTS